MTAAVRGPHVAQISFFTDPKARRPAELLEAWPTLVDVAEAASRCVRVSVLQACQHAERFARNGVTYHFLPFGRGAAAAGGSTAAAELLAELAPEVLHVHGLDFARDVRSLARLMPGIPIILQDHASRLPRLWRRRGWRRGVSVAAGISFCALGQAQPFSTAGLIRPHTRIYEVPESTSRFVPGDREDARHLTAVVGEPAVLWVGHLNANKDPLTVLEGVSVAARRLPQLRLYCCFGVAPLLRSVEERIGRDPALRTRVQLLGSVPHPRVEQLMRAADLFVLGSHHEGSGYSLIEALACGLPPVVTDIPSYRALTGAGAVGSLWPCGDARALSEALQSLAPRVDTSLRRAVRAHFERELSLEAVGRKLAAMYQDLINRARGGASTNTSSAQPQALGTA